jgi:hypothetical protein
VQVLTVSEFGVDLPHAAQVAKIVRHRMQRRTGRHSRETVYVITGTTSPEASPERIAKIVRSQWIIENRLHFVRDTTFAEDASQVRTGHGPDNIATLRSSPSTPREPPTTRTSRPDSARCPTTAFADRWTSSALPDQHSRAIKGLQQPCGWGPLACCHG